MCGSLADDGAVQLPTPSQTGIWKGVINEGRKKIAEIKVILQQENNFCLHFDGKRLARKEFEVVCLQSSLRQLNLGVVICEGGSAEKIFLGMKQLIDESDAWKSIKMMVCDTTAVNTGHKNGVIARLIENLLRKAWIIHSTSVVNIISWT